MEAVCCVMSVPLLPALDALVKGHYVSASPLEATTTKSQSARAAVVATESNSKRNLATVAPGRQVVGHEEGRARIRHGAAIVESTLTCQCLTILCAQLDRGLLEVETVADHQARHPLLCRQVLHRCVDRSEDVKLVLIAEAEAGSTIHKQ